MRYRYRVINPDGTVAWEVGEARSQADLMARLTAAGKHIAEIRPLSGLAGLMVRLQDLRGGIRRADVVRVYRTLPVLLDAGLQITKALEGLSTQVSSPRLATVLDSIRQDVEAGHPLHRAMERHEKVFGKFAIQTVRAAEKSGQLSQALRIVADYEERMLQMRGKIVRALIYPSMVLSAAMVEMVAISIVLLPRLAALIESAGVQMPTLTRLMIAGSRLLVRVLPFLPFLLIAIGLLFRWWVRTPRGRWALDSFLWKAPVIGQVVRRIAVARICLAASTLLRSGVGIRDALALAAPVSGNMITETAVMRVERRITQGVRLSEAVRMETAFPALLSTLIAVGEQSGGLDQMLAQMAEISEAEAWPLVEQAVGMLEPLVIVMVGMVVALIAMSVWGTLTQMLEVVR